MCNGYWEKCTCDDCTKVKGLYEDLEWFEGDSETCKEEIKEIKNKIESMGYFVQPYSYQE